MKYFIIAGEQSGDLHGSNLIKELKVFDPEADIRCWGGERMEAAGARLLKHYRDLAFMGFISVLKNLGTIRKNLKLCREQISEFSPDAVIFIDYPGFNLRIAGFAKGAGYRTFYYISPKFWAWNEGRVEKVKKYIDNMFIIFPFEVEFYRKHGIEVEYKGNPLADEIERRKEGLQSAAEIRGSMGLGNQPVIALLAGSRKNEIRSVLPQMVKMTGHFPGHKFVLAGVKHIPDDYYRQYIGSSPILLVKDRTYDILSISEGALVTSGTATLETALMGIPQVVCFKGPFMEMIIAWMVIKVKYISLVNLIMDSEVVRELIQYRLNEKNLAEELKSVLPGGEKRNRILSGYESLRTRLGPAGASARTAAEMVNKLKSC
jgi:lipid-A-disaccharide synthase